MIIKNKKIVITGSSSGIGFYITQKLLKKNKVIGISRRSKKTKYYNYQLDINDYKQVGIFYDFCKKKFKKIDLLINCAGITREGHDINNFTDTINTNLISTFYLTSKLYKLMKKNSCIINISSIAGHQAFPNNPAYNCSKAGLNMLTKSLALDYAKKKIRVNSLTLGYFKTPMTMKSYNNITKKTIRSKNTMLNRWGKLEDLMGAINFLGTKSSTYFTGQEILLDGGWTSKGMK